MSTAHVGQSISCSRCQSKKIRCNRVAPRCDKCELAGSECQYRARRPRTKKQRYDTNAESILSDVLERLGRLEKRCGLAGTPEADDPGDRSASRSPVDSYIPGARLLTDDSRASTVPAVIGSFVSRIKDPQSQAMLFANVFSRLRAVEWLLSENERCVEAIATAMSEIEHLQTVPGDEQPTNTEIPKELAKKFVQDYYDYYQFEGFKIPLEKGFLLSIPDLLENPHVQVDSMSQIILHTLCLQGIILDPSSDKDNGVLIRQLYRKCLALIDCWLGNIQDTAADLFVAILMVSMAMEGCNSELAWKMLGHAVRIAKALGYFIVDSSLDRIDEQSLLVHGVATDETEKDKNRKRFEFWHLLRTDCLFRLSFGKPTLIPPGSWKVNFPDPTIDGSDGESSRFIQIHFLASMRLTLVVMKYLNWVDVGPDADPISHDAVVDSFLEEVQLIMRDWNTDELLRMAKTQVDTVFCVDMIFSSYNILIVLHQSKRCNQERRRLPQQTVEISRKSIETYQSLLGSTLHAYWGISMIFLHQFIPFFVLCIDIISNHDEHGDLVTNLALVSSVSEHVENIVNERAELRPIMIIMKAMKTACYQSNYNPI